jgi:hypothetical protein
MKRETARQRAVDAIETIIRAAKELAKAEKAYYESKPREARQGGHDEQ